MSAILPAPPQIDAPFRLDPDGKVATVPQGTQAEINAAIYNIAVCPQGAKIGDPDFGIPSPLFARLPLDLQGIIDAIQTLEPRAIDISAISRALLATSPQETTVQITAQVVADDTTPDPGAGVPPVPPISAATYTPTTTFGAVLIDALKPWITLHLAWLCDAIGAFVDPIYNLVYDQGVDDGTMPTVGTYDQHGNLVTVGNGYQPGYAAALDPQQAAVGYGYLSQFVGVQLPSGVDNTTAKQMVLSEAGMARGTPAAVIAAAKRFLNGTQSVALIERTNPTGVPDAGWFLLIVRPEELVSESGLIAAVNAAKFGGLMWELIQSDAPLLSQYTRLLSNVTVTLAAATLADVT